MVTLTARLFVLKDEPRYGQECCWRARIRLRKAMLVGMGVIRTDKEKRNIDLGVDQGYGKRTGLNNYKVQEAPESRRRNTSKTGIDQHRCHETMMEKDVIISQKGQVRVKVNEGTRRE